MRSDHQALQSHFLKLPDDCIGFGAILERAHDDARFDAGTDAFGGQLLLERARVLGTRENADLYDEVALR